MMRKLKAFLKRKKNPLLLTGLVVIIMSYMIGKWFLFPIVWKSLVYEKIFLQEQDSEIMFRMRQYDKWQESLKEEVEPWHWKRVSGGTFQELEQPQEGQGARRAAKGYLGVPENIMEDGAPKYKEYLQEYVYSGAAPKQDTDRDPDREWPTTIMHFWGTDRGADYSSMAFMNDLFYMEIPRDWRIGTNGNAPFVYYHKSEGENSPKEKKITYADGVPEELLDDEEKIEEFILSGGINDLLEDALGQELTEEYQLKSISSEYFSLEKNGECLADIIVWSIIGQVVVRDQRNRILFDRQEDHGRILLLQEWQDVDFSSPEAIVSYMENGGAERLTKSALGEDASWSAGTRYRTEFHEFLRFEGNYDMRQVALYIPITAEEQSNWLILFETFEGSEVVENAYAIQEQVMRTFTLFPYYCVVQEGDTLAAISRSYTGQADYYEEIAAYPTNQISNPDMIYPGQKIEIPLGLRYKKRHYYRIAQ